ncbi:DUF368 domain-containing protein [[Clostridium] leptum]|nr:DUF368 domain-containing protein [[Clostridium] leptum]
MEDSVYKTEPTAKERKKGVPTAVGLRLLQGALIGLGAVLPGISGGVLCVVFGIYRTIMKLLSNPIQTFKKQYRVLIPLILGGGFGFVVVAKLLGFLLDRYPNPSVCLFVGLIGGMLLSLFREAEEKGRSKGSLISFGICFAVVFILLLSLNMIHITIMPNFIWYLFCGFCIALSIIALGMSFSTLLMPLGLYTPLVTGIGNLDLDILIPSGVGAILTVILLAKAVNGLMEHHYSLVFHGIIGVVIAATIVIIPFRSFVESAASGGINLSCMAVGIVAALALDRFNRKIEIPAI